jgi:apolipoprotein N-acyltransferase
LTLSDFLLESDIVSGRGAKILQWPEAAVHLVTIPDKVEFAANLKSLSSRRRAFIGASYTFQDDDDVDRSSILTSMFGPHQEIVYTYAKQALVPVAETYRFAPGRNSLPQKTIFVPDSRQKNITSPQGHNLTISTAICHDTSFDHIVRQAHTASLILVPSSVYSERVAWTRINQLRANARALSTAVLVCDGNREGISAFIEPSGMLRYWQKGAGSFEITAPFNGRRRTAYGVYGDPGSIGILLACLAACAGLELLARLGLGRLYNLYQQARDAFRHRFEAHFHGSGTRRNEEEDLL